MLWLVLPLVLLQISQIPPRDVAKPQPAGTGSIRGRVIAGDTGQPLRRAFVTLMGAGITGERPGSRTLATDAEGRFAFTRLPAGTYRLRAVPGPFRGQYLGISFGGKRSSDNGEPIELAEGQRFAGAEVSLPRGAAITGRVVDDVGEPVTRANVYPSRPVPGSGRVQRTGAGSTTDDLGRFRLYGLAPGEYIITAEAQGWGGPPLDEPAEGFAVTHFPSAVDEGEAARVRVGAADVGDLDIVLVRTRTFRVTGTVVDSQGRQVQPTNAQLIRANGFGSSGSMSGVRDGKFTIHGVLPGDYRFVVRPMSMGPDGQRPPGASREYANVPLTVMSDIDDLVVVTRPGVSVTGRITFPDGPPPKALSGVRVSAQTNERSYFSTGAGVVIGSDLGFKLDDLFDKLLIRLNGLPPAYAVQAVMLGQTDITDTAVEFKPEHSKHLEIVVTSRASTLEGTVTDEKGAPAESALIVMIPEDKASWNRGSPRVRLGGVRKAGQFSIASVLPGRYHVVALPNDGVVFGFDAGPEFFEPLIRDAVTVVINADEKRTVDLRLRGAQQ
jgi:protocatechuate 3,4-dioxygenase beta subunit